MNTLTSKEGSIVPSVVFKLREKDSWTSRSTDEIFGNRTVVVFSLPGAFTPTCSSTHVPRFNELARTFKENGVDEIICMSVNDPFVMAAWGASQGVGPEITMVSDGNAEFTEAVGMGVDASRAGMGKRSKRYAMVIEDGVVTKFLPEEDGFSAIVSTGQCVIDALKS